MVTIYATGVAAIIAFVAVLFADFLPMIAGSYSDQRFLLAILVGIIVSGALCLILGRRHLPNFKAAHLVLGLLFASGFPVLAFPFLDQPYVFVEPGLYAFYFAAIILGGQALVVRGITETYLVLILSTAGAACFVYGAMSVNVYLFALVGRQADLSGLIPWGFVNIRYWSHVATWLLPILPLAALVGPLAQYRLWRTIVAISAGLWWWILLMSTSRGSILGITLGVVFAASFLGRPAWPWLRQFCVYLAVGVAFWLLLSVLIPSLVFGETELRTISSTSSGRLPLFKEAWAMSLQNFPFGMGPQSWLTHELLTQSYIDSKKFGHPHNMYLMWAAEYGWLLIFALTALGIQFTRLLRLRRQTMVSEPKRDDMALLAAFLASVTGALVHAGVSAVFIAPGSMLVGLWILIGFCGQVIPTSAYGPNETPSGVGERSTSGVIWVALVLTIWGFWFNEVLRYHSDMTEDKVLYSEQLRQPIMPRFWFHGNFPRILGQSSTDG